MIAREIAMPPSMPPSTSGKRAAVSPVPRGSLSASGTTSVAGTSMWGGAAGGARPLPRGGGLRVDALFERRRDAGEQLRHREAGGRRGEHLGLLPERDGAVDLAPLDRSDGRIAVVDLDEGDGAGRLLVDGLLRGRDR